jgi:hypothetical protein
LLGLTAGLKPSSSESPVYSDDVQLLPARGQQAKQLIETGTAPLSAENGAAQKRSFSR